MVEDPDLYHSVVSITEDSDNDFWSKDPFKQKLEYRSITFRGKSLIFVVWPGVSKIEDPMEYFHISDSIGDRLRETGVLLGRVTGLDSRLLGAERPVAAVVHKPGEWVDQGRIAYPGEFQEEEQALLNALADYFETSQNSA